MNKIVIGKPFNTEAVKNNDNILEIDKSLINNLFHLDLTDGFKLSYNMNKKDIIYGLGENVGGLNKRGSIYESFCTDDFDHTPDKKSLYAAHNFIIIHGEKNIGLFIDHPGLVTFDIGFNNKDELIITADKADFNLYIIEQDSLKAVVKDFRFAIGQSYIPPKWAFGFQQSRWSYPTAESITEIATQFREYDIPCDTIYMDIDYMDNYKNFTVDEKKFPEFPKFVSQMKDKGFRLIPIIDAGCKIEPGYHLHEEGVKNGYYCLDKEGEPFVGAVWPGKVHFPDFLNSKTRSWFGDKYKYLIDQGIEGFWNDMNEPTIFYSEKGLQAAYDKIDLGKNTNLDINSFFDLTATISGISNSIEDYKSFYHNVDGQMINHYDVHNLYGYYMTKAAGESFTANYPNKRFLLFSRASSVGMHRYGGIWTGDNKSWWEHLILNIKMMPSLNMLGFLYSGADIGGFGCNANAELLTRWTQFGIFTPLMRNHSSLPTRNQEPFSFDKETMDIVRKSLQLRYALIPYIYSEYMKAALNSDSYFRPLSFDYSDKMATRVEDQLLVGDSIMIAPIYEANSLGRHIWLPELMLFWKVDDYRHKEFTVIEGGFHYIEVGINEIPLFIRKDKILLVGNHATNVESINNSEIELIAFTDNIATYSYYDDDGETLGYQKGCFFNSEITLTLNDDKVDLTLNGELNGVEKINYTLVNSNGVTFKGCRKF